MAGLCPAPGPDDPLVRSLLGVVDCNVQGLVRGGYASLFAPSSGLSGLITSLLTIYVAILGYQLLLGRGQLRISDLALTAVKIGVVLALATGWSTYQTLVYDFLFRGPEQLADTMLAGVQPHGSLFRGDVFNGLQSVFDALNDFAKAFGENAQEGAAPAATAAPAPTLPPTLGATVGGGFGPQALMVSAMTLLLSTLGVLLAAKIVLGLLLAIGPVFIVLMLFGATRGLFLGWLRAAIAACFGPLAITLTLGVALTVLEPSLLQLKANVDQGDFSPAPVYSILVLTIVFAAVSIGAVAAGAIIALGLRLPSERRAPARDAGGAIKVISPEAAPQATRSGRVAAAVAALERREPALLAGTGGAGDRRTSISLSERGTRADGSPLPGAPGARLGQGMRRAAGPKARRGDAGRA